MGNLSNEIIQSGEHLSKNIDSISRANATQSAWLLNIDRCFQVIKFKSSYDQKQMRWIDVGCGNGLASIYVASKFNFKSYYLFDFDKRCLEQAKKKFQIVKKSFLNKFLKIKDPTFVHADASVDSIPMEFEGKSIIYLYNPFDQLILSRFLQKNHELIKKGSIIFYLNDIHRRFIINTFKKHLKKHIRNDFYETSVFIIGI